MWLRTSAGALRWRRSTGPTPAVSAPSPRGCYDDFGNGRPQVYNVVPDQRHHLGPRDFNQKLVDAFVGPTSLVCAPAGDAVVRSTASACSPPAATPPRRTPTRPATDVPAILLTRETPRLMTSRFARVAAVTAATAALASGALVAGVVSPASAAVNTTRLGSLNLPDTFTNRTPSTSTRRPVARSPTLRGARSTVNVKIDGPGWTDVIFTSTTGVGFSTTNPISAGGATPSRASGIGEGLAAMNGLYTLTMNCTNSAADIAACSPAASSPRTARVQRGGHAATTTTLAAPATATIGGVTLTATTTPSGVPATSVLPRGQRPARQRGRLRRPASISTNALAIGATRHRRVHAHERRTAGRPEPGVDQRSLDRDGGQGRRHRHRSDHTGRQRDHRQPSTLN